MEPQTDHIARLARAMCFFGLFRKPHRTHVHRQRTS